MEICALEDLIIKSSKLLPSVIFRSSGILIIEGKVVPDHVNEFFQPLQEWIEKLICKNVLFDIDIEYISNNASPQLFRLLKTLNENDQVENITVHWHYEIEDEEHYEKGVIFSEKLNRIKFHYLNYVL
jgi:uncharacterized Fe-S radical SAM superfamily protein PflX